MNQVPLVRPSFPPPETWIPDWEKTTKQTGQFSNFGTLWHAAAEQISRCTGMEAFPCSSGTEAVGLAILAAKAQRDVRRFDVEAFTFEATIIAAERFAGFESMVSSDHKRDWTVRTVPFGCGRNVPRLSIVDAAGGFGPGFLDHVDGSDQGPVAVSFHATKNFPIGEGGCVLLPPGWTHAHAIVMEAMNFGFDDERRRDPDIEYVGNGKLDELRCALLLAQLKRRDYFEQRSRRIRDHSRIFQKKIDGRDPVYELGRWQSLVVVQVSNAALTAEKLTAHGFTSRPIYAPNRFPELLHRHERNLLALPSDMTDSEAEMLAYFLPECR